MIKTMRVAAMLAAFGAAMLALADAPQAAKAPPPRVRLDRGRHGFVDPSGKPFVPFGVSYYRPGTGWAPQLW